MAQDCPGIAALKQAKKVVNVKKKCTMGAIITTLFKVPSKPDAAKCIVLESTCDALTGWVNCAYGGFEVKHPEEGTVHRLDVPPPGAPEELPHEPNKAQMWIQSFSFHQDRSGKIHILN